MRFFFWPIMPMLWPKIMTRMLTHDLFATANILLIFYRASPRIACRARCRWHFCQPSCLSVHFVQCRYRLKLTNEYAVSSNFFDGVVQ